MRGVIELARESPVATTVKQAFDEYRRNLGLTDRQDSLVASRRVNVVAALKSGLRLPALPWSLPQLAAASLLLLAAVLFLAMAGHLAADCVFGPDCVPG